MLNSFISALVAIFFFGKATTETEEKTQCTSWWSVLIYGVLSALVGTFFYKTYQVATIYNIVQVAPIRTCYDEKGHTPDYIKDITIYTCFSDDRTYRNTLDKTAAQMNSESELDVKGGVHIEVHMPTEDISQLRWNSKIPKEDIGYLDLPRGVKHLYSLTYVATDIPSLIPATPIWEDAPSEWMKMDREDMYFRMHIDNIRGDERGYIRATEGTWMNDNKEKELAADILGDGTIMDELWCECFPDTFFNTYDLIYCDARMHGSKLNNLNFFTAADISQVSFYLLVNTQIPIKHFTLQSDIPVEIALETDSVEMGPRGIESVGGSVLRALNKNGILLHMKLPTLANLQLIRSLILTTLLTALISLFGMSLYYCLRRAALNYRRRHALPVGQLRLISRQRINIFRIIASFILLLIIAMIGWWCQMLLKDHPIAVPEKYYMTLIGYLILIFIPLLLLLLLTLLYRWARTPIPPRPEPENSDENPGEEDLEDMPIGIVFNPDSQDDIDQLFEGLPTDDMIELAEAEEEEARKAAEAEEEEARKAAEAEEEEARKADEAGE